MKRIRVLLVDDSSVIRTIVNRILSADPQIEVIGTATDPYSARDKILQLRPDVIILDIDMPRMDGVTFLRKLSAHFPVRTVIFSSLVTPNSPLRTEVMKAGATAVLEKPTLNISEGLQSLSGNLVETIKQAAQAPLALPHSKVSKPRKHSVLAIASSTGGTEALKLVLPYLSGDIPSIVIVQHMPPLFTEVYAKALDSLCPYPVKEARNGEPILPGQAILAPGDYHFEVVRRSDQLFTVLHQQDPLHGVRPAADFLMRSVAKHVGKGAIGLILTGMGKDGAAGLLEMKQAGSYNIAQDEKSCIVFGMPKAAIERQAIHEVVPLTEIAGRLKQIF